MQLEGDSCSLNLVFTNHCERRRPFAERLERVQCKVLTMRNLDTDDTRTKLDSYRNSGTLPPGGLTELE